LIPFYLFKEVDKDNSGSIDQFEFLYWFDLKASLELVTANNGILFFIFLCGTKGGDEREGERGVGEREGIKTIVTILDMV
jgi:hypothetical protein